MQNELRISAGGLYPGLRRTPRPTSSLATVSNVGRELPLRMSEIGPAPLLGRHLIFSPVGLGRKVIYHHA